MSAKDYLFGIWERADHMLNVAKALESDLRDDLAKELLVGEKVDAVGTFNFFIDDREVTLIINESIKIDEAEYDIHKQDLTDEEKDALVFTPGVDRKKLKKLPKDSILWRSLVILKPGKPKIKIIS